MLSKKGYLVEQRNTEELQKIEWDKQDLTRQHHLPGH